MRLDEMETRAEDWEPPSKRMYWLPKLPNWSILVFGFLVFLLLSIFLWTSISQMGEVQESPSGGLPLGEVSGVRVSAEAINLDEYVAKDGLRVSLYMLDKYDRYVRTNKSVSFDATLYGMLDSGGVRVMGPRLESWGPVNVSNVGDIEDEKTNLTEDGGAMVGTMQSTTSGGGLFREESGDPMAFKTYLFKYGEYKSDEYEYGRLEVTLHFPDGSVTNSTDVKLI
jgi:hypothetical protein